MTDQAYQPTSEGLVLIRQFEGFRPAAYPDPLHGWSLATIGYGTTVYADGRKVSRGDQISEAEAEQELREHVRRLILPALSRIPHFDEMNGPMRGALECFAYNLGAGFYGGAHFQTITRVLANHDWPNLRQALLLYVNPGTAVEHGLRRRRSAEADLWELGLARLENPRA